MNTPLPAALNTHLTYDGLSIHPVYRGGWTEYYIQTLPGRFSSLGEVQSALHQFSEDRDAHLVLQRDILSPALHEPGDGDSPWPRTALLDISRDGTMRVESQAYALAGLPMQPVRLRGRVVGNVFEEPSGRHLYLTGLTAPNPEDDPGLQAQALFADIEQLLDSQGMTMHNVVRTWFFLDDILGWYDTFNRVRTQFWRERKVFDHLLPASTGIGMSPAKGGRLLLEVRAFAPAPGATEPSEVFSSKQCPADRYGSSFSRAVLETYPDLRRMHVSGTASINETGMTIHPDDLDLQIEQTLDSVQHLLEAENMGWADTIRAIAYYAGDIEQARMDRHLVNRGANPIPCIHVPGTVCRDDLLFELELEAIQAHRPGPRES